MTEDQLVPYAPDMTPAILGRHLGDDRVLPWLLQQARDLEDSRALSDAIQGKCLDHIKGVRNRRDMASHVVQGLQNYKLVVEADGGLELSEIGEEILSSPSATRDFVFARHILASCNGMRFVEAIQRYELRNERPTLEDLAIELDRHPTAKSVSTMKAWLARAGVFRSSTYSIDARGLERVLGNDLAPLLGLTEAQVELILAARTIQAQTGNSVVRASDAKRLALARRPGVRIPHKGLSGFVKRLADLGVVEAGSKSGTGGTGTTLRIVAAGREFADDHLRALLAQTESGISLNDLPPLSEVLRNLDEGHGDERGRAGEMLAVHLCLALGLRVVALRARPQQAEIDLIAERTIALSYQRWAIQVKNTSTSVDSDRIDRELGASLGTGTTHVLFVAPRTKLTAAASREARVRSRLSDLHVYSLDSDAFAGETPFARVLDSLDEQAHNLALAKQLEARRREG